MKREKIMSTITIVFTDGTKLCLGEKDYKNINLIKDFVDPDAMTDDTIELDANTFIPVDGETGETLFDEAILKKFIEKWLTSEQSSFNSEEFFDDIEHEYTEVSLLVNHLNIRFFIALFKRNDRAIFRRITDPNVSNLKAYEVKRKLNLGL